MKKNIYNEFLKLYWLKPVDSVWDSVCANYVFNWVNKHKIILDLGCGDGLNTAITFGAEIKDTYDRYEKAKSSYTGIYEKRGKRETQFGDIYKNQVTTKLKKKTLRNINYGLELKNHHIKVAKNLKIYDQIFKSDFENIPLENSKVDCIFSIFAFYWGNNIKEQIKEANRVLKKGGEFVVTLPSEHLSDMHHAYNLSRNMKISSNLRELLSEMNGNRQKFVSFHGRKIQAWEKIFNRGGFKLIQTKKIINEKLFFIQDIVQRFYTSYLIKYNSDNKNFLKFRKEFVKFNRMYLDSMFKEESNINNNTRFAYYCLKFKKI